MTALHLRDPATLRGRDWHRRLGLEAKLLSADPLRHRSIVRQATRIWRRNDQRDDIELGRLDLGGESA